MAGQLERRVVAFFCDECGTELQTANACPQCRRILCSKHYFGARIGMGKRKDGLCAKCAAGKTVRDEGTKQA